MKKYFLLSLLTVILSACDNNKKPVIIEEKKLIANKVLSDKIFSPDFMVKADDKLIISSSLSDTMLYIYSLPSLKYLNSVGVKRKGPEEF